MELADAILVFISEIYLKLLAIISPVCALWRYYNSTRHVYIIILELVLILVIVIIKFSSLALTKMDCNRIAGYMMLPVFLGLAYLNMSYYNHQALTAASHTHSNLLMIISKEVYDDDVREALNVVDRVELVFCNGLAVLTTVQLSINLLGQKLLRIAA